MPNKQQQNAPDISELSTEELDALIQRLEDAIAYDLALSADDIRLLLSALLTLATMQESLSDKDITLHKLRKLVGMVKASEKLTDLVDDPAPKKKHKPKRKKKPKKKPTVVPKKIHHSLESMKKGDLCPECASGRVYKYETAQLLRITGQTPFTPVVHLSERLRCNTCGQFFTAPLPDEVLADGESDQKYGYSARSLMAINKYFSGLPFYRQESLQGLLGYSISASTIFDQCEYLANDLQVIFLALQALAADAVHFHLDDTTHRILQQQAIEKKKRHSDVLQKRTGLYASGIIASTADQDIVLFQTNIGHAGEFIDSLLEMRQSGRPPPILMSDALSSNNPTVLPVKHGACNAHGRRNFVDVIKQFPDEVEWVLERYQHIWRYEAKAVKQALPDPQRLAYHQQHSLPVMEEIRDWGLKHFKAETVEENSGLGKAIAYFNKHFERLTLFCTIEGAKLDNNYMEAMLKLIVRNRKNSLFYKTPAGAAISDVITSCLATTMQADANVFEYFTMIQRYRCRVKEHPLAWMPWNYLDNDTLG